MANDYIQDIDLLLLMHSDKPTASNRVFMQLSNDPSVQTRIEEVLSASDSKNIQADYLRLKAFQSLIEVVCAKGFEQKSSLADIYVDYVKNLLEAEPIRTGEQPQSDHILETLYLDATVSNKIKGMIKDTQLLNTEDILAEGIRRLFDKVSEGKFKGESALKTYFTGICKHIASDSIKENLRVAEIDEAELKDTSDIFGDDFTIGVEERQANKALFNKYMDDVFNSDSITKSCKEYLTLKYKENRSNEQIAAIMEKAMQTVKNKKGICDDQLDKAISAIARLKNFLRENFGKY